jgi:hypothetical protein
MTKKYSFKQDHAELKKQIKDWETRIDALIDNPDDQEALNELENISHEMMTVNIERMQK